jgi:hypothetical protein
MLMVAEDFRRERPGTHGSKTNATREELVVHRGGA